MYDGLGLELLGWLVDYFTSWWRLAVQYMTKIDRIHRDQSPKSNENDKLHFLKTGVLGYLVSIRGRLLQFFVYMLHCKTSNSGSSTLNHNLQLNLNTPLSTWWTRRQVGE